MMTAILAVVAVVWTTAGTRIVAQGAAASSSLVGAWTLHRDLSDRPQENASDDSGERGGSRRGGGGAGRGGFGGGRRGGFGRTGGDGGRGSSDPEQRARTRAAMRDLTNPADHLTIVQADNMIIMTGQDGRTIRLSPDGKKIKDDATKIERKTKWAGPNLESEISGLAGRKITQSFSVDPERHQLHITLQIDNDCRPLTMHHVYDADAR